MGDFPVIEAQRLCKNYGTQPVLDGVDLSVRAGETVVVMGPNGAGKTTLLRCLAGSVRPTSGRVYWLGQERGTDPTLRRSVGVVGHESYLYPHLTVEENLLFSARMCDVPDPGRRLAELLDGAGLGPLSGRLAGRLSRGLRQRVSLLRSLVHGPQILLWDEPFSGLDAQATEWLSDLLVAQRLASRGVCMVLHDATLARRLADRIVVLEFGRLTDSESIPRMTPGEPLRASA